MKKKRSSGTMNTTALNKSDRIIKVLSAAVIYFLFLLMPIVEKKYFIKSQLISQIIILLSALILYLIFSNKQITISLGVIEINFLLIVPVYLISAIVQGNRYQVFLFLYDLLIYSILIFLLKKIFSIVNIQMFLTAVIVSGSMLSVIYVLSRYARLSQFGYFNDNLAAMNIFIALMFIIYYLWERRDVKFWQRVIYYLLIILMIGAEVFLSSRSVYLIIVVLVLILAVSAFLKRRKGVRILTILFIIFVLAFIGLLYEFSVSAYKWERIKIWKGSLNILIDNIWVGVGPGNFQYAAYKYNFATYDSPARYALYPNHAHNQWLNIMCETGILSIVLVVFFLVYVLFIFLKVMRQGERISAIALSFLALIIFGFFNIFLDSYALSFLFIGLLVLFENEIKTRGYCVSINLTNAIRFIFIVFTVVAIIFYSFIPYYGYVYSQKAILLLNRGDVKGAEKAIEKAIKLVPNFGKYYQIRAKVQMQEFQIKGDVNILSSIIHTYEVAENLNPNDFTVQSDKANYYLFLASYFSTTEFIYNAISYYKKALENNPFNPFYFYKIAECYAILNDYDKAISELEEAIRLEPNYINAYFKISELYRIKGDEKKGLLYLERGKQLAFKYMNREKSRNEYMNDLLSVSEEYYHLLDNR